MDKDEAVKKALAVLEQQKAHLVQLPRWVLEELLESKAAYDAGRRGLELY
jgi:hypothetical protein